MVIKKKSSEKTFDLYWRSYPLRFKRPVRTSRGSLSERKTFFLISGPPEGDPSQRFRFGEVGFLPGLTLDDLEDYSREEPERIRELINHPDSFPDFRNPLFREAPALLFAWEMLFLEKLLGDQGNDFSSGKKGIPINGLVWMGDEDSQRRQIIDLLDRKFTTLKLKIGGLDFDRELSLLRFLFREVEVREMNPTVRLDANGAFSPEDALSKLERLSSFPIHSIEQPLPPLWKFPDRERRTLEEYRRIFRGSPLPIALDEELIGVTEENAKRELLDRLRPDYLVLKPGIHGGFSHCEEWIRLAEDMKMGWWITSALESNLGLTAIALWTATLLSRHPSPHLSTQGLGTGGLYQNNFISPLSLQGDRLYYDPDREKDMLRDAWAKMGGDPHSKKF